jgi:hypothetical protein
MNLQDIDAESWSEMRCPYCWEWGVEPYPAFCREYDAKREQLINGSYCSNCDSRVPPEKAEKMLAPETLSVGPIEIAKPEFPKRKIGIAISVVAVIMWFVVIPVALFG